TDEQKRDPKKALSIIKDTINASKSNDRALKKAHEAFKKLSEAQKKFLVEKIEIHHSAENINKLKEKIKSKILPSTYLQYVEQVFTRVEGWWLQEVFKELEKNSSIQYIQVHDSIIKIADGFKKDNLPLRYQNASPSEEEQNEMDTRQFVRQLMNIEINRGLIDLAKRAYFRAYKERSQWDSDFFGLLNEEFEIYEAKLVDQWEDELYTLKGKFFDKNEVSIDDISDEKQLKKFGRSFYYQVKNLNIPIRERVKEPYITLGNYHILANKESSTPGDGLPKIYWHPKYKEKK
ncbi:MAG: ABC-three component system protein, partial [Pseudomonadota bacterium]|nr:ABC-three component system protein [Pseudomonadota bacterium]